MDNATILETQKNAIIKMIQTTDKSEFDDDDDDSLNTNYSRKQKAKKAANKHVHTGAELGMQLMQTKVLRWKILLVDELGKKILNSLLNVGDLRALGVTLILNVKDMRQQVSDAPAIYFVEPTKENVDIICKDCASDLYDSIYINFTSTVARDVLEDMASQLVKTDSTSKIAKVCDQFMNFLCLEQNFFSLQLHDIFSRSNKVNDEKECNVIVEEVVHGLVSSIITMGVVPVIVYPENGQMSKFVAEAVEKKVRNLLMTQSINLHESSLKHKRRPALIIMDRFVDYPVMIQHKWAYRAMVHDLLGLNINRVEVPSKTDKQKKQKYDIEPDDTFWVENVFSPYISIAEKLAASVKEYKAKLEEFNKKTGLKLNEDELLQGPVVDQGDQKLNLGKQAIDEIFKLSTEKKRLDMHTNIAYAILEEIKKRRLDEFVALEEKLIERSSFDSKDKITLKSLVLRGLMEDESLRDIAYQDQLRLFLICYLTCNPNESGSTLSKAELEEFEKHMTKLSSELLESKQAAQTTQAADTTVSPTPKVTTIPELQFFKTFFTNTGLAMPAQTTQSSGLSLSFSIFGERLKSVASNLNAYGKTGFHLFPVTKNVDVIINCKIESPEFNRFVFLDPKLPKASSQQGTFRESFDEAIVFVVGGGNYLEYQNLQEYTQQPETRSKRITYGTTGVLSSTEFMDQLNQS